MKKYNNGRRKLLATTLIAGAGMLAGRIPSTHANSLTESGCDLFFLTDNLADFGRAVDSVIADVLPRYLLQVSAKLDECIELHHRLECLIVRLETELDGGAPDQGLQQMRALSEACRVSAQQIKDSPTASEKDIQALAKALVTMSKQLCDRASALLPDKDIPLSKSAAAVLREIICFLNDEKFKKFNEQLSNYTGFSQQAKDLISQFNKIREYLKAAREVVMRLENPCYQGNRKDDRTAAETQLGYAITTLKSIIEKKPDPENLQRFASRPVSFLEPDFLNELPNVDTAYDKNKVFRTLPSDLVALTPADALIINLVWAKNEVKTIQPNLTSKPCDVAYNRYRKVSYTEDDLGMAASSDLGFPDASVNEISALLRNTCPPGSPDQARQCKKIIQSVRKGRWLLSDANCYRAIRKALDWSESWNSMPLLSCNDSGARERLVQGLYDKL